MEDRDAYLRNIAEELGKWADEIRGLKDATKNMDTAVETQYYEQVEDLMALHELAKQMKEYGDAHWEDYKAGMERAMGNLTKSLTELKTHYGKQ
jgi:archaellum component FlaC